MPYERQLKEEQVYKTLSICVELIKSDVNLKIFEGFLPYMGVVAILVM